MPARLATYCLQASTCAASELNSPDWASATDTRAYTAQRTMCCVGWGVGAGVWDWLTAHIISKNMGAGHPWQSVQLVADSSPKSRTFEAGVAHVFGDRSEFCGRPFILQFATIHINPDSYQSGFFCLFPQCWRGSAHFPLERPCVWDSVFCAQNPCFLSLFSAGLLSVQVVWSCKINDLQRGGCNWQALRGWQLSLRILADGHKNAASRAAVSFGDVLEPIGTVPIWLAVPSIPWAGHRRE